ncbi:MAG: DnaJ-class molecular chaperone CbpA [uncultured Sulfurovum sp.]|uniref:DnaJ-class molecular chaperone CbpA n=1 Tax=uncultured Sulfurovum sp. TaxID=269237 RepID=A0A6S6S4V3_9BACT|nr:MAG: DnaJ-class molecular chaperone CbpA [uncultured Sulfurovum sp.]
MTSNEIQQINSDNILNYAINGGVVFIAFFFLSRWFRAYIIRLGFFLFGAWVLWNVSARSSILDSFDFYGGLGMILPQLEIVEITYLLLKERTLFIYYKIEALVLTLLTPFIWSYQKLVELIDYFKTKQEERTNKTAYDRYYSDEFREQQKSEYEKEQARQDEAYRKQRQQEEQKRREKNKKQQQETYQKKQEEKSHSRWDSHNPYIILRLEETATKDEIKKAYRKLAKIYHPDLALLNKEEAQIIFQKINNAYESLQ